jgi:hypothetical protein
MRGNIIFTNVQRGEDEDPGGFGSLVNAEPGGSKSGMIVGHLPVTSGYIWITQNNGSFSLKAYILAYLLPVTQ